MSLPSCCEFHFGEEDACQQGKDCPCRKPAPKQPADLGLQCAVTADAAKALQPAKTERDWTAIVIYSAVVATAILATAAAWHR